MNIIVLSKRHGKSSQINLDRPSVILSMAVLVLSVFGLVFTGGYWLAQGKISETPDPRLAAFRAEIQTQEEQVLQAKQNAQDQINALAARLGQMQAHVLRLDALGRRLTQMAELEDGEFNFDITPAQGGRALKNEQKAVQGTIETQLDGLIAQINDRESQLRALENLMINRHLNEQVMPEGRPVTSGYISSYFGNRADPFTGKTARHKGVDFAGREGNEILAVAAGVVTWSGDRFGFGTMVEINHGNGYVTRYAHNKENLVAVGDKVEKGQRIALMGSTGRATGPNLHFEVLRDGKVVDPLKHIQKTR
ncbi:MAG: M23 family metallopeptidase [Pseudomonadota bacterium]